MMTQGYFCYALMAAALGSISQVMPLAAWLMTRFFRKNIFFTDAQLALLAAAIFAVSLGLPIFYGKRLATWAPRPSSRTARLFPLLLPLLFFFNVVIEFDRPDKLLLVYLTPYALLLFTFCLSYRREQRKEKAASCRDTSPEQEKQTYPHYPLTTVKMTFFLLLSLAFLLPALFFVCGVAPSENSSPWWHSIIMPPFTLAGIAIPLLCGHWLASEAPFPSTFSARYLPFLLPPLLYAAFALYGLFFMDFFKPFLQYKATGMSFLLVYCLFILAFCCSKRTR